MTDEDLEKTVKANYVALQAAEA